MTPEKYPAGIERFDIQVYDSRGFSRTTTEIIREIPLEIFLNDQRVVTIACTGNHVKELAVGFLRAEGLIRTLTDLKKIEVSDERGTVNVYTGEVYPSPFDTSKTIFFIKSSASGLSMVMIVFLNSSIFHLLLN